MEPEISLPLSQKPDTFPCAERYQSTPRPLNLFNIRFNIFIPSMPILLSALFLTQVSLPKAACNSTISRMSRPFNFS